MHDSASEASALLTQDARSSHPAAPRRRPIAAAERPLEGQLRSARGHPGGGPIHTCTHIMCMYIYIYIYIYNSAGVPHICLFTVASPPPRPRRPWREEKVVPCSVALGGRQGAPSPKTNERRRSAWIHSLRGSSVEFGTMQRILAWPLRKDDNAQVEKRKQRLQGCFSVPRSRRRAVGPATERRGGIFDVSLAWKFDFATAPARHSSSRRSDFIHHHHHHPEGVVYRRLCFNSSTFAVFEIASRRWWCIESLLPCRALTLGIA